MASTTRKLLEQTLKDLPEDASLDQAMERLLFLAKIDQGLTDLEEGRTTSHQQVQQKFNQ